MADKKQMTYKRIWKRLPHETIKLMGKKKKKSMTKKTKTRKLFSNPQLRSRSIKSGLTETARKKK